VASAFHPDSAVVARHAETQSITMAFWDFFFILLIFIPLTIAWVYTVIDIFMRPDVGALGKFLWLLLVLFLPLLGMLIYFIVRPDDFEQAVDAL
jgi:hypothetical protein